MTHLFDSVSIGVGETVTREYVVGRTDVDVALFVIGDSDSADMSIEFSSKPNEAHVDQYFHHAVDDEKNVNITDGEVYKPDINPMEAVEVSITNNGNASTTVEGHIVKYLEH